MARTATFASSGSPALRLARWVRWARLAPALVGGGLCSGMAMAASPAAVLAPPALAVVDVAPAAHTASANGPTEPAPASPAAAAAVVLADLPALGMPLATEPVPPVSAVAVPQRAADTPRAALAGLPLGAMLAGAALVGLGWRRARR